MTQTPSTEPRARWLIVEDEGLVAMLIEEALTELGISTIGPANGVAAAIQLVESEAPDGAILDVNLRGEHVYPVADVLKLRGIPFVFLTGYGQAGLRPEYKSHPVVQKPFSIEQMQAIIRKLQSEPTSRPLPRKDAATHC